MGWIGHEWGHHVWRRDCVEVRGDGWHDDSMGVQKMIDEVAGGGEVRLGKGVFVMGGGLVLPGGVSLVGWGYGAEWNRCRNEPTRVGFWGWMKRRWFDR